MTGSVEKAAGAAAASRSAAATADLTLREAVRASEPGFQMALPKHIGVDRFMRAAFTAINTVPRLGECTQQSVLAGLMQAAQLGLEVADVRGQCFLIPRWNNRAQVMQASFQLGYRGMIDLAARSGITIDAEELHENDVYDFALGTDRFLTHRPRIDGPRGAAVAYYATASFADSRLPAFQIMSRYEVEEHRDRFASSRNSKGEITGPWVEHFDAMARKTVIRALLNYLPVAVELREQVNADAIETEAVDVTVDYGSRFQVPALPDGVDSSAAAIDPTVAVETSEAAAPVHDPNGPDVDPATGDERATEPDPAPDEDLGELPLDAPAGRS